MKKSRFSETQIVSILKEAENAKLKRMYADKAMEADALKDVIEKNSRADRETRSDQLSDRRTQAVDLPGLCIGGAVPVGVVSAVAGKAVSGPVPGCYPSRWAATPLACWCKPTLAVR